MHYGVLLNSKPMISVNQTSLLDYTDNGSVVSVEGVLINEFENSSLRHSPNSEYIDRSSSSIWLEFEEGVDYSKARGRRVIIHGVFKTFRDLPVSSLGDLVIDGDLDGFGHFNQWSMQLMVSQIDVNESWISSLLRRCRVF